MSAESTVAPVHEINRLHAEVLRRTEESKTALHAALAAAWHAGQLLVVEKKRVRKTMGGGGWFLWLERYFQGSRRTAQNYMRLAQCVPDIESLAGMSLRQVYLRLGISTEPKSRRDSVPLSRLPPHVRLSNRLLVEVRTGVRSHTGTRSTAVRKKFEQVVDRKIPPPRNRGRWLAEMDGDDYAYRQEMEHLRQHMFPRGPGVCGGLSWSKIQELIRRHQSGTLDLGAFILARDWRKAGDAALSSFRLQRSAAVFVDAVVRTGRPRLLRHFAKALRLIKECETKSKQRALLGHDWWKLNVLVYMHSHPCDGYRTRELRAHLATLGLNVTTKAIRRFCNHHGIRRDERAGRPRIKSHQDAKSRAFSTVDSALSPSNEHRRGSPDGNLVRRRGERRLLARVSTA